MPIKGITDVQKMSRIGKIKIGEKTESGTPKRLDYFRIDCQDSEVVAKFKELYGETPKELPVMFFSDNLDAIFPHYMQYWTGSILWCKGDMETAIRKSQKPGDKLTPDMQPFSVPCSEECPYWEKKGGCHPQGILRFLLPELPTICFFDIKVAKESISPILSTLHAIKHIYGQLRWARATLVVYPFKSSQGFTVYGLRLDVKTPIAQLMASPPPRPQITEGEHTPDLPEDDEPAVQEPSQSDDHAKPDHEHAGAPESPRQGNPAIPQYVRKFLTDICNDPLCSGEGKKKIIERAKSVETYEEAVNLCALASHSLVEVFNASGQDNELMDKLAIHLSSSGEDPGTYSEDEQNILMGRLLVSMSPTDTYLAIMHFIEHKINIFEVWRSRSDGMFTSLGDLETEFSTIMGG